MTDFKDLVCRVEVPGRPPDLHKGHESHFQVRARIVEARRTQVGYLARSEVNRRRLANATGRRWLRPVVYWWGNQRDGINLLQDLKADVDGLVDAKLLVDDRRAFLGWVLEQDGYPAMVRDRQERVVYELYNHDPRR